MSAPLQLHGGTHDTHSATFTAPFLGFIPTTPGQAFLHSITSAPFAPQRLHTSDISSTSFSSHHVDRLNPCRMAYSGVPSASVFRPMAAISSSFTSWSVYLHTQTQSQHALVSDPAAVGHRRWCPHAARQPGGSRHSAATQRAASDRPRHCMLHLLSDSATHA